MLVNFKFTSIQKFSSGVGTVIDRQKKVLKQAGVVHNTNSPTVGYNNFNCSAVV